MSAIKDFSKVWYEKFPGSELPPAWEEDVKNNLTKHKKRVEELQNELQQEQVYVQFLESLLEEVEKRKSENCTDLKREPSNAEKGQERDISDVIKDTLERRSMMGSDHILSTTESFDDLSSSSAPLKDPVPMARSSVNRNGSFSSKDALEESCQRDEAKNGDVQPLPRSSKVVADNKAKEAAKNDENSEDAKDHFVTVIEVNGLDKEKGCASGLPKGSSDESKRLKKVPPRPPPKSFKRPGQDSNSGPLTPGPNGRLSFSSFGIKDDSNGKGSPEYSKSSSVTDDSSSKAEGKLNRPVVFDSRSNAPPVGSSGASVVGGGSGSGGQSNANSANSSNVSSLSSNAPKEVPAVPSHNAVSKPPVFKKFEGSKLPLPPQPQSGPSSSSSVQENSSETHKDRRNSNDRDSSSSSKKPQPPEKENPPVRSKIFDLVNKMEASSQQAQRKQSEQLTPKRSFRKPFKDAPFRPSAASNSSEAIMTDYMDPCDAEFELVSDQIYDSPPPEDSPSHRSSLERQPKRKMVTGTMGSHGSCETSGDFECEPMYDTVAPDIDQEDDYVVLLEEEANQTNNSLPKNSLTRNGQDHQHAVASSNPDASTIKSQTSVISGQSITTTTSSGTTSDTEGLTGSPLPQDSHPESEKNPAANYVNIEYFLRYFITALYSYFNTVIITVNSAILFLTFPLFS
jgi:hypothetical protein